MIATAIGQVVLQPNTIVPRVGSAMGLVYDHKTVHIRLNLKRGQVFIETRVTFSMEGL